MGRPAKKPWSDSLLKLGIEALTVEEPPKEVKRPKWARVHYLNQAGEVVHCIAGPLTAKGFEDLQGLQDRAEQGGGIALLAVDDLAEDSTRVSRLVVFPSQFTGTPFEREELEAEPEPVQTMQEAAAEVRRPLFAEDCKSENVYRSSIGWIEIDGQRYWPSAVVEDWVDKSSKLEEERNNLFIERNELLIERDLASLRATAAVAEHEKLRQDLEDTRQDLEDARRELSDERLLLAEIARVAARGGVK